TRAGHHAAVFGGSHHLVSDRGAHRNLHRPHSVCAGFASVRLAHSYPAIHHDHQLLLLRSGRCLLWVLPSEKSLAAQSHRSAAFRVALLLFPGFTFLSLTGKKGFLLQNAMLNNPGGCLYNAAGCFWRTKINTCARPIKQIPKYIASSKGI